MFGYKVDLPNESASLRCSTRAHQCGGVNLTQAPPGYPTTAAFSAPFSTCAARTDACPNQSDGTKAGTDTSVPTRCSPLKDVKRLANEIKSLKSSPDKLIGGGAVGLAIARRLALAGCHVVPLEAERATRRASTRAVDGSCKSAARVAMWPGAASVGRRESGGKGR